MTTATGMTAPCPETANAWSALVIGAMTGAATLREVLAVGGAKVGVRLRGVII